MVCLKKKCSVTPVLPIYMVNNDAKNLGYYSNKHLTSRFMLELHYY